MNSGSACNGDIGGTGERGTDCSGRQWCFPERAEEHKSVFARHIHEHDHQGQHHSGPGFNSDQLRELYTGFCAAHGERLRQYQVLESDLGNVLLLDIAVGDRDRRLIHLYIVEVNGERMLMSYAIIGLARSAESMIAPVVMRPLLRGDYIGNAEARLERDESDAILFDPFYSVVIDGRGEVRLTCHCPLRALDRTAFARMIIGLAEYAELTLGRLR